MDETVKKKKIPRKAKLCTLKTADIGELLTNIFPCGYW